MRLRAGIRFLARNGLDLFAVLDSAALPAAAAAAITTAGIDLAGYRRVLLIGSAGQRLWRRLPSSRSADPIDSFSSARAAQFARQYLRDETFLPLYPGPLELPLQQLGRQAGWHHDSPLGIGIHPQHGLWFAYRAVLLSALKLPLSVAQVTRSPCLDCTDKPCITACPGRAVASSAAFSIPRCTGYRLSEASACRSACLARQACPVAAGQRYSDEQMAYHYGRSLRSIQTRTAP